MKKGQIIELSGERFRIQKVVSDSIYASKMISEDKCQRGKPRRIFLKDLAELLGKPVAEVTAEALATAKETLKSELSEAVALPPADEEEIEAEIEEQILEPVVVSDKKSVVDDILNDLGL